MVSKTRIFCGIPFGAVFTLCLVLAAGSRAENVHEYNEMGVAAHAAGDWVDAMEAFEQAIELDPQNKTIRHNLSNTYLSYSNEFAEDRDFDSAIEFAKLAISTDPEQSLPLVQLGAYYLHEGYISSAIFRLEEAIELEPENVVAHFLLGESYYKDNDVSSALDQWEWVLDIDPNHEGLSERLEMALREEKVEYDFRGQASKHFRISYTRELNTVEVRKVLTILETAYREVGRSLGGDAYPPAPIHVALYSAEGFYETTGMGEHVGALYDGSKIRCPVFDKSGDLIAMEELKRRLYHEYVHVVVRHIAKDNVPWWLNEGLAETLSQELSQHRLASLRKAKKADALFALSDLQHDILTSLPPAQLDVAYMQSHATVNLLKQRFGSRRIAMLLRALAEGDTPETALRRACRYSYRTLELAVANSIGNG